LGPLAGFGQLDLLLTTLATAVSREFLMQHLPVSPFMWIVTPESSDGQATGKVNWCCAEVCSRLVAMHWQ